MDWSSTLRASTASPKVIQTLITSSGLGWGAGCGLSTLVLQFSLVTHAIRWVQGSPAKWLTLGVPHCTDFAAGDAAAPPAKVARVEIPATVLQQAASTSGTFPPPYPYPAPGMPPPRMPPMYGAPPPYGYPPQCVGPPGHTHPPPAAHFPSPHPALPACHPSAPGRRGG